MRPLPLLVALLLAGHAAAGLPRKISFQARLEDPVGVPVTEMTTVTLRVYDAASGGTEVASETALVLPDPSGLFVTTLGDDAALDPGDFGQELWVGVTVDPAGGGQELLPRIAVRAAPYALRAAVAEEAAAGSALAGTLEALSAALGQPRQVPRTNTTTAATVLPTGTAITRITVGVDGNPLVAYKRLSDSTLEVLHCTSPSCATHDPPTTIAAGTDSHAIAIGTDGYPLVAYHDTNGADLYVVRCADTACATLGTPQLVDALGSAGAYVDIAVGTDGFPVLSYTEASGADLKVAHCTAPDCSGVDTPEFLDTGTIAYTSLAIGNDGFPVVAFGSPITGDLYFLRCTSLDCSTQGARVTLDDTASSLGFYPSVAIGSDGFPAIAHWDVGSQRLRFVHCTSADCTSLDPPGALDTSGNNGSDASLAIGEDGFPVIAYGHAGSQDVGVVHCLSTDCSNRELNRFESAANDYTATSLTIGADGNPVISHAGFTGEVLVSRCGNVGCRPGFRARR